MLASRATFDRLIVTRSMPVGTSHEASYLSSDVLRARLVHDNGSLVHMVIRVRRDLDAADFIVVIYVRHSMPHRDTLDRHVADS